jgi:hypothetical protein
VTRYRWVAARKAEGFPITAACKVAEVSRQAFCDWRLAKAAGPTDAERAESELLSRIRAIHEEFDGTYGEPRITEELARRGQAVNHKRVERLMRTHGIVGVHKPTKVRTTIPAEDAPPLPDLIGRRFAPGRPDVAWVGDITYVATGEGWLYLASVLDLGSRRLLGYSMADHMRTELVADALRMAAGTRGGATAGIIFHGPVGRAHRGVLGQQRGGSVLVIAQARAGAPLPVPRSGQCPPGDLRLDQPLQPAQAPFEPELCPTDRVGEPVLSTRGRPGRVVHVTGQRGDPHPHYVLGV